MKNSNKYAVLLLLLVAIIMQSCKKEDKTFGDLTAPGTPVIDVLIEGQSATAPYGNGSGKVTVKVTCSNGINYKIDFGDGSSSETSTFNEQQHTYSHIGARDLVVTAIVSGKAGVSSTATTAITVQKDYIPSADLVTMLTDNASKTWKVDSVQAGHFGVGPSSDFFPIWWQAGPNEKAGLGIYDDEYTFSNSGNSFSHKTNNSIFGKKEYLTDFDPSLTGAGDYTLTGTSAANYTEPFGYDGDDTHTTEYLVFSGKGHMGLYVGSHKFQVLTKSATQMWLRCIGRDGNAWYVKIKSL